MLLFLVYFQMSAERHLVTVSRGEALSLSWVGEVWDEMVFNTLVIILMMLEHKSLDPCSDLWHSIPLTDLTSSLYI